MLMDMCLLKFDVYDNHGHNILRFFDVLFKIELNNIEIMMYSSFFIAEFKNDSHMGNLLTFSLYMLLW